MHFLQSTSAIPALRVDQSRHLHWKLWPQTFRATMESIGTVSSPLFIPLATDSEWSFSTLMWRWNNVLVKLVWQYRLSQPIPIPVSLILYHRAYLCQPFGSFSASKFPVRLVRRQRVLHLLHLRLSDPGGRNLLHGWPGGNGGDRRRYPGKHQVGIRHRFWQRWLWRLPDSGQWGAMKNWAEPLRWRANFKCVITKNIYGVCFDAVRKKKK